MSQLLVVCSFHAGDLPLALANLSLAQSMGGCTEFDCLLVTDDQTPHAEMQRLAAQTFRRVETLVLPNVPHGWPSAPNVMFERAAKQVWQNYPSQPFLFLEADTTPIRPGWLKDIAASYVANGLPFMGAVRNTFGTHNGLPESRGGIRMIVGRHLNGVGVYPASYFSSSDIMRVVPNGFLPFDVQLSDEQASRPFLMNGKATTGRADSPLFAHSWKTRNFRLDGERFVCDQDDPRAEMDEINPRVTAIYHGCKDASLAELVRTRYADSAPVERNGFFSGVLGNPAPQFTPPAHVESTMTVPGHEYAEFLAWKAQQAKTFDDVATIPNFTDLQQAQRIAVTSGLPHMAAPIVRPEPYAPISAESLPRIAVPADRNNGLQAPIPPDAIAVGTEARLEPMNDPAQRLASLPAESAIANAATEINRLLDSGVDPYSSLDPRSKYNLSLGAAQEPPAPADRVEIEPGVFATPEIAEVIHKSDAEFAAGESLDTLPALEATKKNEAVKSDIRAGMAHKLLLATHHINAVTAKQLRAEVAAENLEPV